MKSGLGKGLGALIPETLDAVTLLEQGERVEQLALGVLSPTSGQPRTVFDDRALAELADSIRQHGILQPLVVVRRGTTYQIIAGERRWRAAKIAGLKTVPVIVRTLKQQEQFEIAIIENVQRVDLSPLEQAVSIDTLKEQFHMSLADVAKRLGKSESAVSNTLRLLQLPEPAKRALAEGNITEGHARQVLALKDLKDQQLELLEHITAKAWTVRQAEQYVVSAKLRAQDGGVRNKHGRERMASETKETKSLSKRYGTMVKIHRGAKGGRLEFGFSSDEELDKLLASLLNRSSA